VHNEEIKRLNTELAKKIKLETKRLAELNEYKALNKKGNLIVEVQTE
jgi:hypothetical protein